MNVFRYSNELKGIGYTNIILLFIVLGLVAVAFAQNRSIDLARKELIIRLEPDLRSGSVRKAWEVPKTFVYSFALTVVQKLNNWQKNGSEDYKNNLTMLTNYITPKCREFLEDDYKKKQMSGQLRDRERSMQEMSGVGFNEELNTRMTTRGAWEVDLSLNMKEFINSSEVKHRDVFWPVRVVEFNIDAELNRQGLALDCFYKDPLVMKDYRVKETVGGSK